MIAILRTSPNIVKALLAAGACPDTENVGPTALMCFSDDRDATHEMFKTLISYGADVNHHDKLGRTPVVAVASGTGIEIIDPILSKGADINARTPITEERQPHEGKSLFRLLAGHVEDDEDRAIAELLAKHVFSGPDTKKRRHVLDNGDIDGCTLLHDYSWHSMPHCVSALIENGASVNALKYTYVQRGEGDTDFKLSWYETPLDKILDTKEAKFREMSSESSFTLEENEDMCERMDRVIALLKNAGGISKSGDVKRKPFVFDRIQYETRAFYRVLREY